MDVSSLLIVGGIFLLLATLIGSAAMTMTTSASVPRTMEAPQPFWSLRVQCPKTGQLAGIDVLSQTRGETHRMTVFRCERFGNLPPRCRQECVKPSHGRVLAS